jgi:NADP-dependent 3-hydroxy acid dehydrogenase YdfG
LLRKANVSDDKILVVCGQINCESTVKTLVNESLAKFGRIDVLVNNAGTYEKSGQSDHLSMESYDYIFDVNLK